MEENHQDKTENKRKSTENKSWLLLSEYEDEKDEKRAQKELARLRKRLNKNEKGASNTTSNRSGFREKTSWNWVILLATLLIPLVIVGATIGLGWWQSHLADLQHQSDQQRAVDQQQAAILQTYMDNIQDLLLNHNLQKSKLTDDVALLARAKTLTALEGLDPERKGRLLIFLYNVNLIGFFNHGEMQDRIIDLSNADLSGADLSGADLSGADLLHTFLIGANFNGASLQDALLGGADLTGAHLDGADLTGAHLHEALNLTQKQLDQVYSCTNAILPPGLTCNLNQ